MAHRYCYRKLNTITIDDRFPLPNIEDILARIGQAKVFSALDLASGFHQIPVHPEDQCKTAFSTHEGHFEFTWMPFGLKNAPATFQRAMNSTLSELIGTTVFVYLDDIVIFSIDDESHVRHLESVFQVLMNHGLKIQLDKSEFMKN